MRAKKAPAVGIPARLVSFEPSSWDSVTDWATARREHFAPVVASNLGAWLEATEQTHRVLAAVLRRGELG